MITVLIILGILFVIFLSFIGIYNTLIQLKNQVKNSWSQIDVQLKRRHDLIPNVVETVKGYAKHERETLENVVKARGLAVNADGVAAKAKAESDLSGAISRLLLVVENYPDLKANQNYLSLQEELTSTENKISFARQNYNDQVLSYNNNIQMFPSNFVANMFAFRIEEFFEVIDSKEKEVPKVNFS